MQFNKNMNQEDFKEYFQTLNNGSITFQLASAIMELQHEIVKLNKRISDLKKSTEACKKQPKS